MKTFYRLALVLVFFVCGKVLAIDISERVDLERYTVLTNGLLRYESGNLPRNGQFRVLFSQIEDPIFVGDIDVFQPISGRPVMNVSLFDSYKASGFIPRWKRSRDVFSIGFVDYVIVATGNLDPNPVPVILSQPENRRVLLGDFTNFSIDAEPLLYLNYQWKFKNRVLPNETSSYLSVLDAAPQNAGIYHVELSTGGKAVKSKPVKLTIVTPVSIFTHPKSQTVALGRPASLRVSARGTSPFTYQWYYNDQPIPLATKSFYSIPKISETNAGVYSVVVDNGPSSVQSFDAVLSIAQ